MTLLYVSMHLLTGFMSRDVDMWFIQFLCHSVPFSNDAETLHVCRASILVVCQSVTIAPMWLNNNLRVFLCSISITRYLMKAPKVQLPNTQ